MQVFFKSAPEKIILVSQFRPPQGQFVIEVRVGLTPAQRYHLRVSCSSVRVSVLHSLPAAGIAAAAEVTWMHVQFPAGLIDEGESASQSAVRELKEETGMSS